VIFWFVAPCNVVVGYGRFGGPYCLHLQEWMQNGPPNRWCPSITPRGATNQKTTDCKCEVMSGYQNAGLSHSLLIVYESSKNVVELKYLGTTVTNQN
jgi:hypothetical protein